MNIVGKKIGLSTQVFSAMILGAVFGLLFGGVMVKLEFIGTIWLNCIKMCIRDRYFLHAQLSIIDFYLYFYIYIYI